MAVGVGLNFKRPMLQQCDEVVEKMGFMPGGTGAPGSSSTITWPPAE